MTPPEAMKFLFSAGMVIDSRHRQPVNTSEMFVICGLSVTLVRFGQARNIFEPSEMESAEDSGKTNFEIPVPLNALAPIDVSFPTVPFATDSNWKSVIEIQNKKQDSPIFVTFSGTTKDSRAVQPIKALDPNSSSSATQPSNVTFFKLRALVNAF